MADGTPSDQERSERPTARRLTEARSEGRVARSAELSAAAVLLAGAGMLATFGGAALAVLAAGVLREGGRALALGPMTAADAIALLRGTTLRTILALLPFAGGLAAAAIVVNLAQTRGVVSWTPLSPKWSHVDPLAGVKRLVQPENAFTLLKAVIKLLALGAITWVVLAKSWPELASLAGTGPFATAAVLRALLLRLATMVGLAFLAVALVDYGFQRFRFEKSLRMTKQEVVREHKDSEGDPMVKGRMLSVARARARRRMLQQVPTADVVVVNPTEIAVALRYDTEVAPAPIVVAIGERLLAARIRAIAGAAGVPIVENIPVARALLATAVVGQPIPPALYAAIAEILAFVYRRRGGLPGVAAAAVADVAARGARGGLA